MSDKKRRRPLHFALSGALLVPGLALGCGPSEEDVNVNVPMPEPEPTGNPIGDEPPPEGIPEPVDEPPPTANPTGEGDQVGIPPRPEAHANPSGDTSGSIEEALRGETTNPVGDRSHRRGESE